MTKPKEKNSDQEKYFFSSDEFDEKSGVKSFLDTINIEIINESDRASVFSIYALNEVLMLPDLFDLFKKRIDLDTVDNETTELIKLTDDYRNRVFTDLDSTQKSNIVYLNRLLLHHAFPDSCPKLLIISSPPEHSPIKINAKVIVALFLGVSLLLVFVVLEFNSPNSMAQFLPTESALDSVGFNERKDTGDIKAEEELNLENDADEANIDAEITSVNTDSATAEDNHNGMAPIAVVPDVETENSEVLATDPVLDPAGFHEEEDTANVNADEELAMEYDVDEANIDEKLALENDLDDGKEITPENTGSATDEDNLNGMASIAVAPDVETEESVEEEPVTGSVQIDSTESFVVIEAGEYLAPPHLKRYFRKTGLDKVVINHPFSIQTSEVAVGEFRSYVESLENNKYEIDAFWAEDLYGNLYPDDRPVDYISREDALDYANWLSREKGWDMELPTQYQWMAAVIAYGEQEPVLASVDNLPVSELRNTPDHLIGNLREWSSEKCGDNKYLLVGEDYMTSQEMLGELPCVADAGKWKGVGFRLIRIEAITRDEE